MNIANIKDFFNYFPSFPCKAFKKHFEYLTETERNSFYKELSNSLENF